MAKFPNSISAEHLLDTHITLEAPQVIGATPLGQRSVFIVTGGTFEGHRLRGTVLPGGGDWLLSFAGGHNELDVRATIKTDDGALIYVRYQGVLHVDPAVAARGASGEDLDPASYYFRVPMRFETGHEKYAWLNTLVCIGYGAFGPGTVSYRVFGIK
jgi:hypothetical protein